MSVTLMLNSPWTSGTGLFTGVAFFVRLKHKQLNLISLCGQSINLSGSFKIQKMTLLLTGPEGYINNLCKNAS